MATQALIFVLETIFQLFTIAVLVRFWAQVIRLPFRGKAGNPIVDFVLALTDWIVLPLRRLLPGLARIDLASFLVAWLAMIVLALIVFALLGFASIHRPLFWPTLLSYALVDLVKVALYALFGIVMIDAILSWVNPYHPLRTFFGALAAPFLRPLRRLIPLIGGVDLSPLVLLLVIQVLLMLPVRALTLEAFNHIRMLAAV
jgi:YggT family protein